MARRVTGVGSAVVLGCLSVSVAACNRPSGGTSGSPDDGGGSSGSSKTSAGAGAGAGKTVAGAFDSCSVVTQAQAAAAIGEGVSSGVLGSAVVEGGLACVFYGPSAPTPHDPNKAQGDTVRVVVVKGGEALTWYNDYKSKVSAQPVGGFGDQAYYDGYASLSVMKGSSYLRIAVAPAGRPPSLEDEKKLAAAILPVL